ncbi:MAG TPA: sterol desaturase family protein [Blastocatellia bacterium]|nr:sterol desaturase family protein [Blastocatellia bacterium]
MRAASWPEVFFVFFVENLFIFALVIVLGSRLAARYNSRRVALRPDSLPRAEVAVALCNVLLNTAITVAGLILWRRGVIEFRSDAGALALTDVLILLLVMDLLMYLLHRVAHTRVLYSILHQFHHRYDRPRPLTLFALNPVENLAFGTLWLVVISVYDASWLGMSIYLALNVVFGAVGHLGVEPLPEGWAGKPVVKYIAGGSFHAQHHQDIGHNYGFYTLIWDRIFGTVRPDYEQNFGRVPDWAER